jgi:hypothetical protein
MAAGVVSLIVFKFAERRLDLQRRADAAPGSSLEGAR